MNIFFYLNKVKVYLLDCGETLRIVNKSQISRVKVDPNQVMGLESMCYRFSFEKMGRRNVWRGDPIIKKKNGN